MPFRATTERLVEARSDMPNLKPVSVQDLASFRGNRRCADDFLPRFGESAEHRPRHSRQTMFLERFDPGEPGLDG